VWGVRARVLPKTGRLAEGKCKKGRYIRMAKTRLPWKVRHPVRAALLFATLAAALLSAPVCPAAEGSALPAKPDLDVTYISQRPLYVGYWMDYDNDVPRFWVPDPKAPDGKRAVARDEYIRLQKYQHADGDPVTFTVHIRNNGFAPAPRTNYRLYIDDTVARTGKIDPLQIGEEVSVTYLWTYKEGPHTISCDVDTENRVDEISEMNNRLTDPTWGIGLTIRAGDESAYEAFRSTTNMWGTYSFEDWCQAHIQEWRKAFREAIYPATPQGVLQGIRFDGIYTSLEDPALLEVRKSFRDAVARSGQSYDAMPDAAKEWFEKETCNWRIIMRPEDIPAYAKKIDRGLLHELCHQCGMIDLYMIGMHPNVVLVTDPNGHFLWLREGCYNQFYDLMAVTGDNAKDAPPQRGLFREHTAAAFNSEIGLPRWGYGLFLFDVPEHNLLKVLDNRGRPIQGAQIKLYQQEIETKTVGTIPPKTGRTDENGEWDMGSHPIDKIHVVGTNAIMVIEIQAYGQSEYHCLVLTELNIAYWRGDRERHVYTMETGIAPPDAVPPPTHVTVKPHGKKEATLTWEYPADVRNVQKFIVMERTDTITAEYNPPFEEIVAEVWASERSAEVDLGAPPGYGFRSFFVVVALDQMGDRSAYSNIALYADDEVLPQIDAAWGAVETPDGSIYVINSDVATVYGVDAKGGLKDLFRSIRMEPQGVVGCMATDNEGNVLYVPNPKGNYIYRVDLAKAQLLPNLECAAFQAPRGIALAPDGNFFVTDVGNSTVHIITKTGELLGSFGGPDTFACPRNVFVDKKGRVYVADCQQRKEGPAGSPGTVIVLERVSRHTCEFEPVLTINGLKWSECVVADEQGRIYVGAVDGIHVFDSTGRPLAHWVSKPYGTPLGGAAVFGLAWSKNGDLLVTQGSTLRQLIRVSTDEIFASRDAEN
jgi:DNA-binding beta-propeller fold protein YncE